MTASHWLRKDSTFVEWAWSVTPCILWRRAISRATVRGATSSRLLGVPGQVAQLVPNIIRTAINEICANQFDQKQPLHAYQSNPSNVGPISYSLHIAPRCRNVSVYKGYGASRLLCPLSVNVIDPNLVSNAHDGILQVRINSEAQNWGGWRTYYCSLLNFACPGRNRNKSRTLFFKDKFLAFMLNTHFDQF